MGNVLQAGEGQDSGKTSRFGCWFTPNHTPSTTINKVCASGMKAVTMAAQAVKAGDVDIIVVTRGMENMSSVPLIILTEETV